MEPFVRTNCKKRISLKPSEFNLLDYFEKKLIEDPTVSITKLQKLLNQNSHILHSFVELGGLSKIKEWLSTYLHRNDEESILSWLKILNHENFPFDYDIVIELGLGLLVNDIQQRFPKCQSLACSIRDKWTEQGTKWSNMKAVRRVRHKKAKNKIKNGSLNSSVEFNNGTNSSTNGDCNKENNNNNSDNSSSNTNTINNNNNSSNNNSEDCEPKTVQFEDSQLEIAVSFRKSDAPMTVSTKNNKNNNNNNGSMENRQNNSTKSILKKVSMFDRRGNSNVNIRGSDSFDKEMSNENGSVNSPIDENENDNENDNDINENDPLNFDCDLDLEKERRIFEQQHLNNSQNSNSNSNSNVNSSKINSFEVEIEDDDIKLDDLIIGQDNKNRKGINGLMIENGSKDNNNNINKKGKKKEIEGLFDDDDEDEDEDDEEGEIEDDDIDIDIKESKGNENKNGNGNETIVRKNRIKIPSSNIKQNGNAKRRRSDEENQNCNNSNNNMNNNSDNNNNKNNGKNDRSRRIRYDNSNEHRILRLNREKELEMHPIFRQCKREIPWQKPEKMHLPENTCFCKYRMKYLSNSADQTYISEVASQEQIRQRRTPEKIYKERKDIPDNPRNVKTNYQLSNENDKNDKNEKEKELATVDILLEYKYVSSNTQYNIAEQFIKSSFH